MEGGLNLNVYERNRAYFHLENIPELLVNQLLLYIQCSVHAYKLRSYKYF